jgi:predicted transcriptional regulator
MNDELHEKTRALLREAITSFEMLEIVLLMRAQPETSWTAATLAGRVHIPDELVDRALHGLHAAGLAMASDAPAGSKPGLQFQYKPANADLAAAADALAADFAERRAAVLSTMSTTAIERLRSGALNAFADAFVFGPSSGSKRKDG